MNTRLTLFALALAAIVLAGMCNSFTVADGGPILVCPPKDKKCWADNPLPHVAQQRFGK